MGRSKSSNDHAPVGSSAGQHLVDANYVERMHAYSKMEGVLSRCLGDVFVGTDPGSFKGFTRQLLILV